MKTILVGVDFTKSSENALNYAIEIAKRSESKILLFHALTTPVIHTNSGLFLLSVDQYIKDDEKKMVNLQNTLSKKYKNITFSIEITYTGLKDKIERLSEKNKIRLVVLGLETKTKLSKFIYGTTSVDLAGHIKCPIVTISEKYKQHRFKKMLIAIDNKESVSSHLSKRIHAVIKMLSVTAEFIHVKTEDELNIINKTNHQFKCKVIEAPNFEDGITQYSKKTKADIIMLISHSYNAFYSLFVDSHSKKIIFSSNVPVISIHK